MAFWIFGTRAGRRAAPLYLDVPSSEAARDQATALGLHVETIVFTGGKRSPAPAPKEPATPRGSILAGLVVWMFRGIALTCALLTTLVVLVKWEAVKAATETQAKAAALVEPITHALWGTLVVAVLLAIGETVRLFSRLEVNTRTPEPQEQMEHPTQTSRRAA